MRCHGALARRGYEVVMAMDGEQAVAMAQSRGARPDSDGYEPAHPDGWEATQRIKAMPATHTIPVIALTAHAMSSDREKVLEVGCDDYHAKPVEFPRLLEQIEAILKRV